MNHSELRLQSLTQTIMNQMAQIEIERGQMFHELDADLETAIFEAIDSKQPARLNLIITQLDSFLMD